MTEDKIKMIAGLSGIAVVIGLWLRKGKDRQKHQPRTGNFYEFTLQGEGLPLTYQEVGQKKEKYLNLLDATQNREDSREARAAIQYLAKQFGSEAAETVERCMYALYRNQFDRAILSQTNAFLPVSGTAAMRNISQLFGEPSIYGQYYFSMQKPLRGNLSGDIVLESALPDFFYQSTQQGNKWFVGYYNALKFYAVLAQLAADRDTAVLALAAQAPEGFNTFTSQMPIQYED